MEDDCTVRICSSLIGSLLVTRSRDVSVTVSEEETPVMDRSRQDHNYGGKLNGSRRTPHELCSIIVIIWLQCSFVVVVVVVGVDIWWEKTLAILYTWVADESVILQSMIATVTCAARAVGFLHQTPLALTVLYISVAMWRAIMSGQLNDEEITRESFRLAYLSLSCMLLTHYQS